MAWVSLSCYREGLRFFLQRSDIVVSPATAVALPPIVPAIFGRQATLPVFELDKADVNKKGARIARTARGNAGNPRSRLGTSRFVLDVTDWQLFHAAAKTELARTFTVREAARRAICFSVLYDDIFEWNGDLALRNGAVESRKDSARTNAAGRFGESCCLRLMEELRYVFWDHLPTLWLRAQRRINHAQQVRLPRVLISQPGLLPAEQPDFIVEEPGRRVALAESKGRFVAPSTLRATDSGSTTAIKTSLAEALMQLNRWPPLITPAPASSYAVATFLRERADTRDPSLIAFADPVHTESVSLTPVELPPDFIRRGNYGAWLIGMGFRESGEALREMLDKRTRPVELAVVRVNNRDFAFSLNTFHCPCIAWSLTDPEMICPADDALSWVKAIRSRFDPFFGSLPIIGLDASVLRKVGDALPKGTDQSLLEVGALLDDRHPEVDLVEGNERDFLGSIAGDGSLFGVLPADSSIWKTLRTETFWL